jgi:integrase
MQAKINKTSVDALAAGKGDDDILADSEVIGFTARRLASGTITFIYRYRNEKGERKIQSLGIYGKISPEQARTEAKKAQGKVAGGQDVVEERKAIRARDGMTVNALLDRFIDGHLKNLASAEPIKKFFFDKHVRPALGDTVIYDLKRADIMRLLDKVAAKGSDTMADRTLAYLRKALNWYAIRDEKFTPPLVRGMARVKPLERARDRILDDDEIADLWQALDELVAEKGIHPLHRGAIHTLMLTTMRLRQVVNMPRAEIRGHDWLIPKQRNRKTKVDHLVHLTEPALAAIGEGDGEFVFSIRGDKPLALSTKVKANVDRKLAEIRKAKKRPAMRPWTWHDLRRTGRSLLSGMSDQGVTPDHAERVLGHILPGLRRTYDIYNYKKEKQRALECLSAHIASITRPRGGNVVRLKPRRSVA